MVSTSPTFGMVGESRGGILQWLKDLCRIGQRDVVTAQYAPSEPLMAVAPLPDAIAAPLPSIEMKPSVAEPVQVAAPVIEERPFVLVDTRAREIVLTADERRARAIALRGLSQARGEKYEAAHASFVQAVQMDPQLDLAKLPDFWRLPSAAHQAAVDAYEFVGRNRDAAALTALVRSMFKPRLVPSSPAPVSPASLPTLALAKA